MAKVIGSLEADNFVATGSSSWDANSNTIENVADPVNPTDAANKQYVDGKAQGLDTKESCRVATDGTNITDFASGAPDAMDSISLAVDDRILVKDQSLPAENGIYKVTVVGTGSNGTWVRAEDADENAEVTAGLYVWVTEGSTHADTGWVLTTDDAITVGSTPLTFTQFTGASQIVAGNGLTKAGNTLDVGPGDGIAVNANDVAVNSTVARRNAANSFTGGTMDLAVTDATAFLVTDAGADQKFVVDTMNSKVRVGDGTTWVDIHEDGTIDTNAAGGFDFDANVLTNIGAPAAGTDAATKDYVDNKTYSETFTSATTWTVTHNLGSTDVITQFYDNASPRQEIVPDTVKTTDANTVTATFTVGTAGRAVIRA